MGNDGGSIPKREELVKVRKRKQLAEKEEQNRSKWKLCALSKQVLVPPIVACKLGYLYNKTAVLECLLDNTLPPEFSHIRKAKRDLINLNLSSIEECKFVCPVTGLTMGGNYKFVALVKCGCVIAERAFKEIPDQNTCLNCSTSFDKEKDILPLNGTQEEINERREVLKVNSKSATGKKRKSSKKKDKRPKKVQKVTSSALGPLIASSDIKAHMPKDANPEIYKSLFTSSVKDLEQGETFCCRHAAHRLG